MPDRQPLRFEFHSTQPQAAPAAAAAPQKQSQPIGSGTGDRLVPAYEITVDGQALSNDILQAFIGCEVRQSIKLATMFVLRFHNPAGSIGDSDTFNHGGDVEVKLGYMGALDTVAKGTIVSVEPVFPQGEDPYVIIRGYGGGSTKLSQGKKTRTFSKVKVSDIVQQLGQEEGLQVEADDTSVVHDYLMQNNQSNLEFIQELGRRHYREVEVIAEEGKLRFQPPGSKNASAGPFEWNKDLKSFYVRKTSHDVPSQVVAKGWDPSQKQTITGTDNTTAMGSSGSMTPDKIKQAFGGETQTHQLSIRPMSSLDEANAMAHAAFNEKASEAQMGRGTILGNADVKPGITIELKGLGTWSGKYYVTNATHVFHPDSGYSTEFFVKYQDTSSPSTPAQAIPPAQQQQQQQQQTFVELELVPVDTADVVGTGYKITLPDGRVVQGRIDETRKVRIDGITNAGGVKVEIEPKQGHQVPGSPSGSSGSSGSST
jgi:phage protein D